MTDERGKLLDFLDSSGSGDPERDHVEAERLLLEWLKIVVPTVAEAWAKAKEEQCWWYA